VPAPSAQTASAVDAAGAAPIQTDLPPTRVVFDPAAVQRIAEILARVSGNEAAAEGAKKGAMRA